MSVLLAVVVVAAACTTRDDDDGGGDGGAGGGAPEGEAAGVSTEHCTADPTQEIEGDTIRLVSSFPQSGLTAPFSEIARGWKAYFDMVNEEQGGVEIAGERYRITYEDRDDQYNAPQTVNNIRDLVGEDGEGAFATFSVVGTPNNLAIREFLHQLCVPNVFAATGSPAWGNPEFPWTIGSTLQPYTLEGQVFAELLARENPDATVAMLLQDDDFGEAYEQGFRQAIEGTGIEVVAVERYATGEAEVAAQMTSLAASNADAFFNGATLLACPNALQEVQGSGWDPITWVSTTCISKTLMGIAGQAADGVYSMANLKDPLHPTYEDDEAMQTYLEAVRQYQPQHKGTEFDPGNAIVGYGWTQGAVFVEALEQAEAPTRLAVMESVRNLGDVHGGLLLDEVTVTTGPEDPYMGETLQLAQYQYDPQLGENSYFVPTDDPLFNFEGETANPEITPRELIVGPGG